MRTLIGLVMLACSLMAPSVQAESRLLPRDNLAAFVDGFVEARMTAHNIAGLSVAIVHQGELVLAKGYGHADLANGRRVDASRTLFRPGSISKLFTWTAVMQLVEQGQLSLDANIRRYLPDFPLETRFDTPITLADLMAHRAGFEDSAMGHLFEDDPTQVQTLRDYLVSHHPTQVRPPGTLPAYSNFGVALAGLIVAEVSGMSWEAYAEQHLFAPLGMAHSTFREPWGPQRPGRPMSEALRAEVSRGYVYRHGAFHPGGFAFISGIGPAGALSTTATDMARWMLAQLNAGELDGLRILAAETARRMHRQHATLAPGLPGIAHGFIESEIGGYRAIGHGGGTVYFVSDLQLIPALGLGVFVSTNTPSGEALVRDFVRELVTRYFPGPSAAGRSTPDSAAAAPAKSHAALSLDDYVGSYLSTRRAYTTVEALLNVPLATIGAGEEGDLLLTWHGRETRLARADDGDSEEGSDTFVIPKTGERVRFLRDEAGQVTQLALPIPVMVMEKVSAWKNPQLRQLALGAAMPVFAAVPVGAWLRRRRRSRQAAGERWAGRLIVAATLAWLATFATGLVAALPLTRDAANVFYHFPSPLFLASLAIALLAAGLTLINVGLLYPVWHRGHWPNWRRLRHTLVVLIMVTCTAILWSFNALGFHFLGFQLLGT